MKTFRRTLTSTLFALVAFAIPVLNALPSSAQLLQPWKLAPIKAAPPVPAIPVIVTNTPLPVSVTNPVTVGNSLTIGSPVTVGNSVTSPVPTRDVDNLANEPYLFFVCLAGGTLASQCTSDPISQPPPLRARPSSGLFPSLSPDTATLPTTLISSAQEFGTRFRAEDSATGTQFPSSICLPLRASTITCLLRKCISSATLGKAWRADSVTGAGGITTAPIPSRGIL